MSWFKKKEKEPPTTPLLWEDFCGKKTCIRRKESKHVYRRHFIGHASCGNCQYFKRFNPHIMLRQEVII